LSNTAILFCRFRAIFKGLHRKRRRQSTCQRHIDPDRECKKTSLAH
jgi:hypothetical protein